MGTRGGGAQRRRRPRLSRQARAVAIIHRKQCISKHKPTPLTVEEPTVFVLLLRQLPRQGELPRPAPTHRERVALSGQHSAPRRQRQVGRHMAAGDSSGLRACGGGCSARVCVCMTARVCVWCVVGWGMGAPFCSRSGQWRC